MATLKRLRWKVLSANQWENTRGDSISLDEVAPLSVKKLVGRDAQDSVWKQASLKHPHIASVGCVPLLAPIVDLLTKTDAKKNWGAKQQATLRSITAGVFHFGGSCALCGVALSGPPGRHFFYECDATKVWRDNFALGSTLLEAADKNKDDSFFVSALLGDPLALAPSPNLELKVVWSIVPPEGPHFGPEGYGDGASILGPDPRHIRCAWSVVCITTLADGTRAISAAAGGNLPMLDQSVPGAEAYALLFYLRNAIPGQDGQLTYNTDNAWVHQTWGLPRSASTGASCVLALLWVEIHKIAEEIGYQFISVNKVKAHRKLKDATSLQDGDDIFGNNAADQKAKEALSQHQFFPNGAETLKCANVAVGVIARYLVHVVECFRAVWGEFPKAPATSFSGRSALSIVGPADPDEAHWLVKAENDDRWRCAVCWASSADKMALAKRKCTGSRQAGQRQHAILSLPGLAFCAVCGHYSKDKVRQLKGKCEPPAPGSSRFYYLRRMLEGKDPSTSSFLGAPVPFTPYASAFAGLCVAVTGGANEPAVTGGANESAVTGGAS